MAEHRFVVVCSDGTSYDLSQRTYDPSQRTPVVEWGKTKKPHYALQDLLEQGWLPIRETAMGGGDHVAFALVLLTKGPATP